MYINNIHRFINIHREHGGAWTQQLCRRSGNPLPREVWGANISASAHAGYWGGLVAISTLARPKDAHLLVIQKVGFFGSKFDPRAAPALRHLGNWPACERPKFPVAMLEGDST